MWEKIIHLATSAGMTCLMRANVGEIASTDGGIRLMLQFLETNANIAACEGRPPSEAFMAEYRSLFSDAGAPYTASMLRDIERGGPIEAGPFSNRPRPNRNQRSTSGKAKVGDRRLPVRRQ
jgi:2-dehydropantoate 2-reductase